MQVRYQAALRPDQHRGTATIREPNGTRKSRRWLRHGRFACEASRGAKAPVRRWRSKRSCGGSAPDAAPGLELVQKLPKLGLDLVQHQPLLGIGETHFDLRHGGFLALVEQTPARSGDGEPPVVEQLLDAEQH